MRWGRIIIVLGLLLTIIGCSSKKDQTDQDIFYECQKILNKIETYSCEVEITCMGNKKPKKYLMKQWFKKPNKYKLQVISPENLKGKTTISNGEKAWICHPAINQTWIMQNFTNSEEQNMFLGYFIKNCLSSEKMDMHKKKIGSKKYLVIDTSIPGNHVYFNQEKLWIDTENMQPFLLQVFDGEGKMRIEVRYNQFQYNPKLKEEMFCLSYKEKK